MTTIPASYTPASQVGLLRRRLAELAGLAARIDACDLPDGAATALDQLQDAIAGLLPILAPVESATAAAPSGLRPTTDLATLLLDLEARWSPRALRRGLGFAVVHPQAAQAGGALPLNGGMLDRALTLLLDRALAVSLRGTIRLRVDRMADGGLTVTVQDTGPPDADGARDTLAPVAAIARALGASLTVTPSPAAGLAAALRFPGVLWAMPRQGGPAPDAAAAEPGQEETPLDPAALDQLFRMTGAAARPALLARVTEDLGRTDADLAAAARAGDLRGLRAATHVLIALAGTIGAHRLATAARAANAAAHDAGAQDCAAMVPALRERLDQARAAVAALNAAPGTATAAGTTSVRGPA